MATHVVADGVACEGLVLLAYPLHPPGKPERLRAAHLERIMAPMLFLQGTRDPFADPTLLARTLAHLPGASRHRLEGGDHGHKVAGRTVADVAAELADATVQWLDTQVGR
jgi:predicted alpha/beta-hydrolase family hydrolase